jgi:hypothetical protein
MQGPRSEATPESVWGFRGRFSHVAMPTTRDELATGVEVGSGSPFHRAAEPFGLIRPSEWRCSMSPFHRAAEQALVDQALSLGCSMSPFHRAAEPDPV